jgi:3'-5' exoribonuclease
MTTAETHKCDMEYLMEAAHTLNSPYINLCTYVINNIEFQDSPASHHHHHAYPHGLAEHTAEVLQILEPYGSLLNIDRNTLLTAGIWHDFHKIFEYNMFRVIKDSTKVTELPAPDTYNIEYTPYANMIGHVVGSYTEFCTVAERVQLSVTKIAAVGHCLLAHHGRQTWGSPVEPQTEEAFLLHMADMRSVQKFMLRNGTERRA